LHSFNIRTPSGLIEDPEGDTYPSLRIARKGALAKARDMIAKGDQKGADRHDGSFEIGDRANHHVLTVAFSEISKSKLTRKGGRCYLPAPDNGRKMDIAVAAILLR
jgi:hypothetical protein